MAVFQVYKAGTELNSLHKLNKCGLLSKRRGDAAALWLVRSTPGERSGFEP